jgi:predicted kinase
MGAAKARGFAVSGYWFDVPVKEALARNAARPEQQRVPVPGIYRTAKLLQRPQRSEGFDQLFRVQLVETRFVVEPMMEPD